MKLWWFLTDKGFRKAYWFLNHDKRYSQMMSILKMAANIYLLDLKGEHKLAKNLINITDNRWVGYLKRMTIYKTEINKYLEYRKMSRLSNSNIFNKFDTTLLGISMLKMGNTSMERRLIQDDEPKEITFLFGSNINKD